MLDVLIIQRIQKAISITKKNIARCRLLWIAARERYYRSDIKDLDEAIRYNVGKKYAEKHLKEAINRIKELKEEKLTITIESENSVYGDFSKAFNDNEYNLAGAYRLKKKYEKSKDLKQKF